MTRVYTNKLSYKIFDCRSFSSLADIKKNYYRLLRLFDSDEQLHISSHISQLLNEIYLNLSDQSW